MKNLNFLILAAILLFSQTGMLDHVYSEHHSGEVCDYCIAAPSLDNALTHSAHNHFSNNAKQQHIVPVQKTETSNTYRFYTARAPPRLI